VISIAAIDVVVVVSIAAVDVVVVVSIAAVVVGTAVVEGATPPSGTSAEVSNVVTTV
jgi:hypothetical protein